MRNVFVIALLSGSLAACASNHPTGSADLASAKESGSTAKTKRVCETERSSSTGSRLRRVCRTVAVEEE